MYSISRNKLSNAQRENASSVLSHSEGSACEGRAERDVMTINAVFRRSYKCSTSLSIIYNDVVQVYVDVLDIL
jgi:hypothetical protein